jgi:hypothetical protein
MEDWKVIQKKGGEVSIQKLDKIKDETYIKNKHLSY